MISNRSAELYYDPFDYDIDDDPYPVWKRMRAEAPLYFNDKYGFYALSRYDDVAQALPDWQTYRSGRGTTADISCSAASKFRQESCCSRILRCTTCTVACCHAFSPHGACWP